MNCPLCLGATYCCSDHQQKAKASHTLRDGEDGPTQVGVIHFNHSDSVFASVMSLSYVFRMTTSCGMCFLEFDYYWLVISQSSWSALPDKPGDVVHWAPDHILPNATSLPMLPGSWEAYYASTNCPYIFAPPLLRTMVSFGLSMPLTILDALQHFSTAPSSIGSKMVVHVLGAQMDFEMKYGGMAFEEIMHQLPWIKELVVVFVRPIIDTIDADEIPMKTCMACSRAGKKRTYSTSK
jgi:hypothetical protein